MIRKAKTEDLPEIRRVYDAAKAFMDRSGNPNQWKKGHPPQEVLEDDIEKGQLYVIDEDGIRAVFAYIPGEDPTYRKIDGDWLRSHPYAAIHRVASDGTLRGVFAACVSYCRAADPTLDLRIDTHEDNHPMQRAITSQGFSYCGIIYLENGSPRLAYQWKTEAEQ